MILIYGFVFSGDFKVSELRINGVSYGDSIEVAAQTNAEARSIFEVDAESVAERVTKLPYVQSASVELELPNRLVVDVVERQPVVIWQTEGATVAVDAYGVVVGEPKNLDLPTVQATGLVPEPGGSVSQPVVAAVQAIASQVADVAQIDWSESAGLLVTLNDGRTIDFGIAEQLPAKLTVYQAMQAQLPEDWQSLDLSVPTRPAYR